MLAWIKERLGYHVCRAFTKWERREKTYHLVDNWRGCVIPDSRGTHFLEERRCTVCGFLQQREVR